MEMLNEMAIFVSVVECAGFTAAARALGVTTSSVSRHVKRLETKLGGRLLQRTTRSVKPTELGEKVYESCARMLFSAREVQTLAGSYNVRPNGMVRVTAPVVFGQVWLAPRLPGFLARHPDVTIQLSLVDRNVDLVLDGVDLAIRIAKELSPGLAARRLCDMSYVLVASPAYLAKRGQINHPRELNTHDCIHLGYGSFGDTWTFQSALPNVLPKNTLATTSRSKETRVGETVRLKAPSRATANNSSAILAMVQANGGIGLIPDFTAQTALNQGNVVRVLPLWNLAAPYTGTVHAVYLPTSHLPLKTRALIDYLVESPLQRPQS